MWEYHGQSRPAFAKTPGPGQESVWDYPRPPLVQRSDRSVRVVGGGDVIARTTRAVRILETASPPTWYLPPDAIHWPSLMAVAGRSFCEWKGEANYWALASDPERRAVAWSYPEPAERFRILQDHVSFYPGLVGCFVDGERVRPQPGGFYGGWVTDDVVGPFKGAAGTGHW